METRSTSYVGPLSKAITNVEVIWSKVLFTDRYRFNTFCFVPGGAAGTRHTITVNIYACTDNSPFKIPDWDGTGANWQLLETFTIVGADTVIWKYHDHAYYAFRIGIKHNNNGTTLPTLNYSSHHVE